MKIHIAKIAGACLLVFCLASAYGQEEHVFAFVLNREGKSGLKPAAAYKYDVTAKVFNDLLRARGDVRQQAPALVMNDGEQYVAWMDPVRVRIGLEEKAYDVCTRFGADSLNAIAALLAHELTHYFEKHDWSRNFVHAHRELDAAKQIGALDEGVKQETQADYIGGFLAFSAGYNVYDLMPRLMEQLYKSYGLPEKLAGYPGLVERVQVSRNAMGQLRELQSVFETARLLSILEQYEDAASYYRYILQQFQSREVYNNTGANLAMAAMSYFSVAEMPFVLPFEMDTDSRLYNIKNVQAERLRIRSALLEQAGEQFDRALALDPAYAPGYLNKACIYAIGGEWDDAAFWLKKGKRLNDSIYAADFIALEGILHAMQKDSAAAHVVLADAKAKGSVLAGINLDILLLAPRTPPRYTVAPAREVIDGIALDDYLRNPATDKEVSVARNVLCGAKNLPLSSIRIHFADEGRQYAVVHRCTDAGKQTTQKGIGNGAAASSVKQAYGSPPRVVADPGGAVWVYPGFGLLFWINKEDKVESWGAFRKSG